VAAPADTTAVAVAVDTVTNPRAALLGSVSGRLRTHVGEAFESAQPDVVEASSPVLEPRTIATLEQGRVGEVVCDGNDGKLETVAVGSKIGLFTCGSDGEWHFGWLINAVSAPRHKTVKPVSTGAIQHGVLQTAKAYR
jgi:hypothetical protein